jgi:predicted O-linked N-acetylglucosamine transferase (SPINDLY family)
MPGTFHVAYMGLDDRPLAVAVGRLYACLHPPLHGSRVPTSTPRAATGKLKVGFLSAHFRRHSVCKLWCGMVARLPRERFQVYVVLSSDNGADAWTALVGRGAVVVRVANGALETAETVAALRLDVLVVPALGMHQATYLWASQRLARVQVVAWGHPVTSGLPSVDYFVSSDLFEPLFEPSSRERYSEQLVRFDSTSFVFPWPDAVAEVLAGHVRVPGLAAALAALAGSGVEGPLVAAVPQALMKLHPDLDAVLAEVLRGHPHAVLVLLHDPSKPQHVAWRHRLEQRLAGLVGSEGMARVVFLGRLHPNEFLAFLRAAAVVLDPFPFGGGVTTLEGFAVCAPVVTAPSLQTVPHLAAGMYRKMGLLPDSGAPQVAASAAGLAKAALALLWNATARADLVDAICSKRHLLFDDGDAAAEWAAWLERVARAEHLAGGAQ